MKLLFLIVLLMIAQYVYAEQTKMIFNPFTSKLDYITALTTTSVQAGSGVTVSTTSSGVVITGTGSGNPAGLSGNVQYNNAGSFGGASFFNIYGSSATSSGDTAWLTSSVGPILTDSNSCTWRTGVNTSGVLTTALLNCPGGGFILMEDGTFMLQEDNTKILVE